MGAAGSLKRVMKRLCSSSQVATEDSDKWRSRARGAPTRAIRNQLAMILSSPWLPERPPRTPAGKPMGLPRRRSAAASLV